MAREREHQQPIRRNHVDDIGYSTKQVTPSRPVPLVIRVRRQDNDLVRRKTSESVQSVREGSGVVVRALETRDPWIAIGIDADHQRKSIGGCGPASNRLRDLDRTLRTGATDDFEYGTRENGQHPKTSGPCGEQPIHMTPECVPVRQDPSMSTEILTI